MRLRRLVGRPLTRVARSVLRNLKRMGLEEASIGLGAALDKHDASQTIR
jgi:hypothetical protein